MISAIKSLTNIKKNNVIIIRMKNNPAERQGLQSCPGNRKPLRAPTPSEVNQGDKMRNKNSHPYLKYRQMNPKS